MDHIDNQSQRLEDIQSIGQVLDTRTTTLESDFRSLYHLQADQLDSISKIEANTLQTLHLLGSSLVDTRSPSGSLESRITSIHENLLLQNQIQNLKLDEIDGRLSDALSIRSAVPESLTTAFTGTYQAIMGMCKLLAAIFTCAVKFLARTLNVGCKLWTILSIMHALPMAVSWKLSDNIEFIDVLGRIHGLPFQQVRSWSSFKSMLITRFQDVPGSDRVASGHFKIMVAKATHVVLDENNYAEVIEPHMRLVMSIELVKLRRQVQRGSCLRHSCLGTLRASGGSRLSCSQCGLQCYEDTGRVLQRTRTPMYGPKDFRAEVRKHAASSRNLKVRNGHRGVTVASRKMPNKAWNRLRTPMRYFGKSSVSGFERAKSA